MYNKEKLSKTTKTQLLSFYKVLLKKTIKLYERENELIVILLNNHRSKGNYHYLNEVVQIEEIIKATEVVINILEERI